MTKEEMIQKLNGDLSNEYMHMNFYLHHAATVQGLHRSEIGEYLLEHAQSEMKHVHEFSKVIIGMGGKLNYFFRTIKYFVDPQEILEYALSMEDEVVANYVERMADARELGGVDGSYIEIFLEDQILDSRGDADNLREMVKKFD